MPKNDVTLYPPITSVERQATSDDKNKANSNPIKPNFSSKTQVQTQKQTQFKAKLRQFMGKKASQNSQIIYFD